MLRRQRNTLKLIYKVKVKNGIKKETSVLNTKHFFDISILKCLSPYLF